MALKLCRSTPKLSMPSPPVSPQGLFFFLREGGMWLNRGILGLWSHPKSQKPFIFRPGVWILLKFLIITARCWQAGAWARRRVCNQPSSIIQNPTERKGANNILSRIYSRLFLICIYSLFGFILFSFTCRGRVSSPLSFVVLWASAAPVWCFSKPRQRKDALGSFQQKELVGHLCWTGTNKTNQLLNQQNPEIDHFFSQIRTFTLRVSCNAGNIWGLQPMGAEWEYIGT